MNDFVKKAKKALSAALVAMTVAWSIGASAILAPLSAKAAVAAGTLVKASQPAVYYVGTDGKRYVFPNEKTYKTWFADFSGVQTITDAELASLVIGGNVTYRPGVQMVKITTDPKVYAVDAHGTLRHIASESVAIALYGANWATKVHDVPDAFFVNYALGSAINSASDFNVSAITAAASSISIDKQLTAVSGAVTVSLDSSNPAGGSIIANSANGGQARINVLALKFSGSGTVNTLKLKRIGINADQDIDNVYLYEGNNIIAEMQSISAGVITFSNSSGLFTLSGSDRTIMVKFDLNETATSGKTIGFSVNSAADVVLAGGSSAAGSFPFNGNLMQVATVSDLGRATIQSVPTSPTTGNVDPGTTNSEIYRMQIQGSNQDLRLYKLRLHQIGSINKEDLADLKLMDGANVLATVAAIDASGFIVFDLSANPFLISNGLTKQLAVQAHVKSGSSRTIRLSLEKPYDFDIRDSNYNIAINPDNGTVGSFSVVNGNTITVNAGSLTMVRASDSPTGVVALSGTNIALTKVKVTAIGESLKFSAIDFKIAGSTWTNIRNARVLFDGAQVGTTQTSINQNTNTNITVNFTVTPGSDHFIEIRADISGTGISSNDTLTGSLVAGSSNVQALSSLNTLSSVAVAGNSLVVSDAALTVVQNPSLGAVTLVGSQSNQRIASWLMTTNTSQGVDLSTIVITDSNTTANVSIGSAFTNLMMKKNGVAIAPVVVPNTSDADAATYTFNLSPALAIPANSTIQIDLYADVLTGADTTCNGAGTNAPCWNAAQDLQMNSSTGTGQATGASVSGTTNVLSQAITIQGAGTLALAVDGSSPIGSQHVMGSTNKTIGVWKFDANNVEDLNVSQIIVHNDNSAASGSNGNVTNLKLFVAGAQVGSTVAAFNGSGDATFGGLSINVPRAGSTLVTLKGDIASFTANPGGVGVLVRPEINLPSTIDEDGSADTVVARGASGTFALVGSGTSGDKTAENQFPYRTTLSASIACQGSCSGRTRNPSDVVGKLTFTGGGTTDAQFRAALQANDESDGNDGAGGNDWVATGTAITFVTTHAIDSTNNVRITEDGASAVGDHGHFDFGTSNNLRNYSKVTFAIESSQAKSAGDLTLVLSQTADTTDNQALDGLGTSPVTVNLPALSAGVLAIVTLDLSGFNSAVTYRFATINVAANVDNGAFIDIDDIRFYNDSITLDVSGNLCNTAANCVAGQDENTPVGHPILLKTAGGVTVGRGYYNGTATSGSAIVILGDDIGNVAATTPTASLPLSLGSSAQTFDIVTNTNELVASESTNTELLAISMDLGNAGGVGSSASAGDFRWWDQGVAATSPITFVVIGSAGTPINVSLGY
jgi:hypothetical protein